MTMTTTDPNAELRQLIERLERALGQAGQLAAVTPFAAVNPDGTPGNVASGELIEAAWGNATSDTFSKLKLWTASVGAALAGPEVQFFSGGSIASIGAVTVPSTGMYLAIGSANAINRGTGLTQGTVQLRINGSAVGLAVPVWLNAANEQVSAPLMALTSITAGSRQLDIQGAGVTGTFMVAARQIQLVRIQ